MRRVLFDENLPRQLRRKLSEFSIRTVQEEGWGSFKNGQPPRLRLQTLLTVIEDLRTAIATVRPGELVVIDVLDRE